VPTTHDKPVTTPQAPFDRFRETVRSEWIDYNGHMNVAYYVLVFDRASDAFLESVGLGPSYAGRSDASVFAVEAHITYDREVVEGTPLAVTTQVLDADAKRLHLFHAMRHAREDYLAATTEVMLLHVDMTARRASPWPEAVRARLDPVVAAHAALERPTRAGRAVGAARRP